MALSEVTFLLKSFLRPSTTLRAARSIREIFPEAEVLVVDDSDQPESFETELEHLGARLIRLPYDSGLSAGRNAGLQEITTEFVVIMDDDMVVTDETRVPEMLKLLRGADIVCAAMRQDKRIRHWEGTFDFPPDGGCVLQLHRRRFQKRAGTRWTRVDFGLNCFVSRSEFLRTHPWDESLKMREHTDFFLRLKGVARVLYTPDCIFEHRPERSPAYMEMRSRDEFRRLFFHKHGFRYFVGTSGRRDDYSDSRPMSVPDHSSQRRSPVTKRKSFVIEHRTFLDSSGKATRNANAAVCLFAIPGQHISLEKAREVGLLAEDEATATSKVAEPAAPVTFNINKANKPALLDEVAARGLETSGTETARQLRDLLRAAS